MKVSVIKNNDVIIFLKLFNELRILLWIIHETNFQKVIILDVSDHLCIKHYITYQNKIFKSWVKLFFNF